MGGGLGFGAGADAEVADADEVDDELAEAEEGAPRDPTLPEAAAQSLLHLLQSGVDITVIALWLGHENPSTTHMYIEADLEMKERALSRLQPPDVSVQRYRPPDKLMGFLPEPLNYVQPGRPLEPLPWFWTK